MIDVAKDVSGNVFIVSIEPRSAGDPRYSLAMPCGQKMDFTGNRHWQTAFAELEDIVKTAWRWETDFYLNNKS